MNTRIIFIIGIFLFWGCSSTSTIAVRPTVMNPSDKLKSDIDNVLNSPLFNTAHASVKIVSVLSGESLYEHENTYLMNPASNVKLFTAAAAIGILGNDYVFKTSVLADTVTADGTVWGNLYLKGWGDPLLSPDDLDTLARKIKQYGIRRITGNIVADNSYFDDVHWGLGWTWDDEPDPDAPFISALTVNKGCLHASVFSDSERVFLSVSPVTSFLRGINTATFNRGVITRPLKIRRTAQDRPNVVIAEGEVGPYASIDQLFSVRRPDLFAAQLFSESLQRNNINVAGDVVSGTAHISSRVYATTTHSLDTVIIDMNKTSNNLSAENVLKVLGAVRYGPPGTAKTGMYAVNSFLSSLAIDSTQFIFVDGSGVSRYNLVSADNIVRLLTAMYRWNSFYTIFSSSLPVAGVDGTLSSRMTADITSGNILAKTGSLNGVSCLSGYAKTKDGELLAFSILMQNYLGSSAPYRQIQDKIGKVLTSFSRKPSSSK